MANHLVQARIDREIKEEAATVLAGMGLTVSDAVRLLLTRVAREKALPFAPLVPNAETIAAMKEARTGNLPRFDDVESLFDDLHADDRADATRSYVRRPAGTDNSDRESAENRDPQYALRPDSRSRARQSAHR